MGQPHVQKCTGSAIPHSFIQKNGVFTRVLGYRRKKKRVHDESAKMAAGAQVPSVTHPTPLVELALQVALLVGLQVGLQVALEVGLQVGLQVALQGVQEEDAMQHRGDGWQGTQREGGEIVARVHSRVRRGEQQPDGIPP